MVNLFHTSGRIVLSSQSPRRQKFLKDLGIRYFLLRDMLLTQKENNAEHALENSTENSTGNGESFFESTPDFSVLSEFSCDSASLDTQCGVVAKDDTEDRPKNSETPEHYVSRMALSKALDAMHALNLFVYPKPCSDSSLPTSKADSLFSFDALLNTDKKEILNLSYAVEKHVFQEDRIAQGIYPISPTYSADSMVSTDSNSASTEQSEHTENLFLITADTIVALGDEILGKPHDEADALRMLRCMVGRKHRVLTSVCVVDLKNNCVYAFTDIAFVHFAPWSTPLLEAYIRTGDPMDKAGSYGIQGVGMFLSDGIQGSWDTVAGLPVAKLLELLLYSKAIKIAS